MSFVHTKLVFLNGLPANLRVKRARCPFQGKERRPSALPRHGLTVASPEGWQAGHQPSAWLPRGLQLWGPDGTALCMQPAACGGDTYCGCARSSHNTRGVAHGMGCVGLGLCQPREGQSRAQVASPEALQQASCPLGVLKVPQQASLAARGHSLKLLVQAQPPQGPPRELGRGRVYTHNQRGQAKEWPVANSKTFCLIRLV